MTGSGKTGLSIALLEEAAIDGIPAIVVDPKGDLGNSLLDISALGRRLLRAWTAAGANPDDEAKRWKEGLAAWGRRRRAHPAAPRRGGDRDLHAGLTRGASDLDRGLARRAAAGGAQRTRRR